MSSPSTSRSIASRSRGWSARLRKCTSASSNRTWTASTSLPSAGCTTSSMGRPRPRTCCIVTTTQRRALSSHPTCPSCVHALACLTHQRQTLNSHAHTQEVGPEDDVGAVPPRPLAGPLHPLPPRPPPATPLAAAQDPARERTRRCGAVWHRQGRAALLCALPADLLCVSLLVPPTPRALA